MNKAVDIFWQGCEQGQLKYQQCQSCQQIQTFPSEICPNCGGTDLIWHISGGSGTVYAKTIIHRAPTPELAEQTPYAIVLVNLAEGFRIMGHTSLDVEIGSAVQVEFHPFAKKMIPFFKPGSSIL